MNYIEPKRVLVICTSHAASKIQHYNPDAKIIILLRDPIERAYSHYAMNVGLGRENRTFEAVVSKELQELKNGTLPWYGLLNMSCYDMEVARYQQLFKNVLVLQLKDFVASPVKVFEASATFLQIAPFANPFLPKSNEAIHLKNKQLVYRLKKTGLKDIVSTLLSAAAKRKILKVLSHSDPGPILPKGLEVQLEALFRERSKVYFEAPKVKK